LNGLIRHLLSARAIKPGQNTGPVPQPFSKKYCLPL
jgi:hypothetical protein